MNYIHGLSGMHILIKPTKNSTSSIQFPPNSYELLRFLRRVMKTVHKTHNKSNQQNISNRATCLLEQQQMFEQSEILFSETPIYLSYKINVLALQIQKTLESTDPKQKVQDAKSCIPMKQGQQIIENDFITFFNKFIDFFYLFFK